jgi:hypothetical protein
MWSCKVRFCTEDYFLPTKTSSQALVFGTVRGRIIGMTAIAWVLGLGIFAVLFAKFPKFRLAMAILLALGVITGLGIYWYTVHQDKISKSLISPDDIELKNLSLRSLNDSYLLYGEIKNNSEYNLTSITLEFTAYDCPTDEITPDCEIIGEDEVYSFVIVPAGQVREIDGAYLSFYNMPTVKGSFQLEHKVKEIRGDR